mgnify:CR=1 FL=1
MINIMMVYFFSIAVYLVYIYKRNLSVRINKPFREMITRTKLDVSNLTYNCDLFSESDIPNYEEIL